ncbi:MAG: hypothetical protein ABI759_31440 [Candidatus Solibacter sp.]
MIDRADAESRYVEIPGDKTHELPPLLLHCVPPSATDLSSVLLEAEDMLGAADAEQEILEQRKLDLALQLTEQYKGLVSHWTWGDSVIDWIRQCEITFESEGVLRQLLHPDVWPHASRASFVELLRAKAIPTGGVALDRAVGLRLAFRQPPPIDCFSSQFLFLLNATVADTAYHAWSHEPALFPPHRFHFDVLSVS